MKKEVKIISFQVFSSTSKGMHWEIYAERGGEGEC